MALVVYGFLTGAATILLYIVFNRTAYTLYETGFLSYFWYVMRSAPFPNGLKPFTKQLYDCFFVIPGPRFFIPDTLPIPLPYYWLLVPGFALALWQKRFEVVLAAIIPVVGAFVATSYDNRLLLVIPFWTILMAFTFAGVVRLRPWPGVQILLCAMAGLILLTGLGPSVRYIYGKTKSPFSIRHYAQEEVAGSRFLKHVVAGQEHPGPPHLERDEFNRIPRIPDPPYDTLICPGEAYSIIHLFLHDYDDTKVLSFCGGSPMLIMTQQNVWRDNKMAIFTYVPSNKALKLIWESGPTTRRILEMLRPLRDLATEESISFSFAGRIRTFNVLNIPYKNIRQFQERVRALPDALP